MSGWIHGETPATICAIALVAIFFVYLQRFLMESLTAGAVKG